MASLTTQTSPSSSTHEWGVFLSFHGRDTRQRITAHLYKALEQRSISTFRDDKELERGRYISPELLNAIENSMYAVVVLSPYYAFSRWCLTELTKIVECMEKKGLILLPVFYQVDPFDVRNQKGTFTEAFVKHENDPKIVGDDLQSWKSALSKVGNISGWDLRDRDESTVIEEIVGEILAKLNSTFSTVSKKLVGIDSRLEKLMNLYLNIRQDDVRFLGIWGMGGIGKTTLARAVYDKISRQFKVSSFIANVRETSTRGAIVDLQKQLLSDLFKDKSSDIKDVDRGKNKIRHGLRHRRPVLVVVDDVDQSQQLEALAIERDWFGGGSVIIITTRDKHLLIERGLAEDEIYRAKEFDDDEALQLFSWKAFKKDLPLEGFVELSKQIIHYANGLPLAIEVLGRFLCRQNVEFWESALRCLSKNPKKEIVDTLKISFDGLEENEQKIFLDIACYFKGEKYIDRVKSILESCDYHPSSGIEILINKSLITISRGKLWMHDLLQEMGHEIVHRQSQGDPGRQSRLWHTNDIIRVLENNSGTNWIEGIVLNSPLQEELHLNSGVFLEMKNLRLLKIIGNVHLSQGLCYLSTELRVMEWHGYALKSLPMGFPPDKLVELNMRCSHIQQLWQGTKSLYKLEHVDLSDSRYLVETPDFTNAPNLKRLILQGCKKLVDAGSAIEKSTRKPRRLKNGQGDLLKEIRTIKADIDVAARGLGIPMYFQNQSMGSSITIQLHPDLDDSRKWLAYALYFFYEINDLESWESTRFTRLDCEQLVFHFVTDEAPFKALLKFDTLRKFPNTIDTPAGHWIFVPHMWFDEKSKEVDTWSYIEVSITTGNPFTKVEKCGAQLVYEQNLHEFMHAVLLHPHFTNTNSIMILAN
ncbi:hypothetical protein F2P56_012222 [Juglans regia]|uniref:ADP-ribosyl cyclase/cyclic ADP-ribose hydrolase n=2 Tax=Juglans regia TaxID=51240 RepID=A0A833XLB9_JUGRE|nr:disease resistance protein RPV1-like isoform X3 [Juglans regia]KAF5468029.1 hypothetical protein F2P56_012222 [Juglans regia]